MSQVKHSPLWLTGQVRHCPTPNQSSETDTAITISLSHTMKKWLPNHSQVLKPAYHKLKKWCHPMLWWCHPTLPNQPIASLSDYVIPECYAANMPYIRAWTTSAKQGSWGQAGELRASRKAMDKQQRPEKEDRAKGRGKSKAKDHTLQQLVYRK